MSNEIKCLWLNKSNRLTNMNKKKIEDEMKLYMKLIKIDLYQI